jgi:hypothetical protein
MEKYTKPENLNGSELRAELRASGVLISDDFEAVRLIEDSLFLDIAKKDHAKALAVVEAHNGTLIGPEPTIEEKLANIGLNVAELKSALGI